MAGRRSSTGAARRVTVVRRADCLHGVATVAAVRSLARALGLSIAVEERLVETDEDARANRCVGSPTVLVDGQDIEPAARERTSFAAT